MALLCWLATAAPLAAAGAQTGRLSTAEVAARAAPSVVMIETPSGTGSGVILDSSGVIVTNLHVIRGDTRVTVYLANGDIFDDPEVIDVDARRDIVLLKIKAFGLPAARLGDSDSVRIGAQVVVIGSPQGFDQSVSMGIVSAARDSGDGYRVFQTDAAASPGSSGGGMFDDSGELIGIVSAKATDAENVNFALPANYVRGLVRTEAVMTLSELAELYPRSTTAAVNQPINAQAEGLAAGILPELLAASSFEFESLGNDIWVIPYIGGDHLDSFSVSVSAYGDFVLTQAFLTDPPDLEADQLRYLLRLSYDRDLAKIGIDPEGDLAVLHEVRADSLDTAGLERIVDNVAFVTDEVAGFLYGDPTVTPELDESTTAGELTVQRRRGLGKTDLIRGATLSLDPEEWIEERAADPGTRQWVHTDGDVYFKVIAERIEIPYDTMLEVVVHNALQTADEARITTQGFRRVNGQRVMWLEMDANIKGIAVTFYSHIYSGPAGTLQLHAWTGRNLLDEYRGTIESLVSGFEVTAGR